MNSFIFFFPTPVKSAALVFYEEFNKAGSLNWMISIFFDLELLQGKPEYPQKGGNHGNEKSAGRMG